MDSLTFVKNTLMIDDEAARPYLSCIDDFMANKTVLRMHEFRQHANISCLEHCLHVSYTSYAIGKKLGMDYRTIARGALLHDFFLYDWRVTKLPEGKHAFVHPRLAHRQAVSTVKLTKGEEDIILKHMWPVTIRLPRYKETWVVLMVDKYCATVETLGHIARSSGTSIRRMAGLVIVFMQNRI